MQSDTDFQAFLLHILFQKISVVSSTYLIVNNYLKIQFPFCS